MLRAAAALLVAALSSFLVVTTTTTTTITVAARAFSAERLLCLTNFQRRLHRLPPLALHPLLNLAAAAHSHDQARHGRMTHAGSDGSTPARRIARAGYHWRSAGENVAYGYPDEARVMRAWMKSPGHRANILSPKFRVMGVAVAYRGGRTPYYTQNFAAGGSPGRHVDCARFGISTSEHHTVASGKLRLASSSILGRGKALLRGFGKRVRHAGRKLLGTARKVSPQAWSHHDPHHRGHHQDLLVVPLPRKTRASPPRSHQRAASLKSHARPGSRRTRSKHRGHRPAAAKPRKSATKNTVIAIDDPPVHQDDSTIDDPPHHLDPSSPATISFSYHRTGGNDVGGKDGDTVLADPITTTTAHGDDDDASFAVPEESGAIGTPVAIESGDYDDNDNAVNLAMTADT